MQIDKYGNDVGYEKRLKDIENRYGSSSNVYKKCYILIQRLQKENYTIKYTKGSEINENKSKITNIYRK